MSRLTARRMSAWILLWAGILLFIAMIVNLVGGLVREQGIFLGTILPLIGAIIGIFGGIFLLHGSSNDA